MQAARREAGIEDEGVQLWVRPFSGKYCNKQQTTNWPNITTREIPPGKGEIAINNTHEETTIGSTHLQSPQCSIWIIRPQSQHSLTFIFYGTSQEFICTSGSIDPFGHYTRYTYDTPLSLTQPPATAEPERTIALHSFFDQQKRTIN